MGGLSGPLDPLGGNGVDFPCVNPVSSLNTHRIPSAVCFASRILPALSISDQTDENVDVDM